MLKDLLKYIRGHRYCLLLLYLPVYLAAFFIIDFVKLPNAPAKQKKKSAPHIPHVLAGGEAPSTVASATALPAAE